MLRGGTIKMKKAKLVDIYKHTEYVLDIDPNGRIIVEDGWYSKLAKFEPEMPADEIEKCLIALGFKKDK